MKIQFKKIIRIPKRMFWAAVMEGIATKEMVEVFAQKLGQVLAIEDPHNGPSEAEMEKAMRQLKDLPLFLPFIMFIVTPIPGVAEGYVLLATSLEKWLGHKVSLLPFHFRNIFNEEKKGELEFPGGGSVLKPV